MNKLSFKSTLSLLFSAALISGIGDGLIPIAFALQAHRVDSSGRGLTMVLIALWSGRFISSVVVRKLPPPTRPVGWMLSSDVVRLLAQWGLVAWVLVQGDSIASFAVSSFVYGCASSFFTPARFGLLALLFTDSQRTRVNGTLSILGDVLYIAGPLIGTAAVITLGFRTVLLIDGATFLIAMLFVLPFFKVRRNSATDEAPGTPEPEEAAQVSDADHADHVESPSTDAASAQTKVNNAKEPTPVLPRWVQVGLGTWLVASLVNGFLGSAGPTWIMNSFDEKTWGFMATALAIGSLLGSAATILRKLDRVRFTTLQFLMLLFLAGQLLALAFSPMFIVIALVGAVASLLMTSAGVSWDSLGQSLGKNELVHQFATKDQLVFTAGTPMGMLLFAALSGHPYMSASILSFLLVGATIISCLPLARSPRVADVTDGPSALGT